MSRKDSSKARNMQKLLASQEFPARDSGEFPALPGTTSRAGQQAKSPKAKVQPTQMAPTPEGKSFLGSVLNAGAKVFTSLTSREDETPVQISSCQEEIQRVRKQIEDMDTQLKDAFKSAKYEDVKEIGVKKKELEEKLRTFEDQYSNDKVLHELKAVKDEIAKVEEELKAAFSNENYTEVADLGRKKEKLEDKLRDLESNFGLHNAVYQQGDRVSVVGLVSPRGKEHNGCEGTVIEYNSAERKFTVLLKGEGVEKKLQLLADNLRRAGATPGAAVKSPNRPNATAGQSKTRQMEGEIKLWFPRKHFGFIMPDNKPENDPDIFFHGTHVENRKDMPIKRFARVKFSVIPAPKGPQARDVSITNYQPEKEKEAEEAEAAKLAAEGGPAKTTTKKKKKKKKGRSKDGHFGDIDIEDSLDRVSPAKLGFDERKGGRSSALRGSIKEIRENRKVSRSPNRTQRSKKKSDNVDLHRNWGSISSALGSMNFDSISSVTQLFRSRSNGSKTSPESANRPQMSIMGSGAKRRGNASVRNSIRNNAEAQKILADILAQKGTTPAGSPSVRSPVPALRPRNSGPDTKDLSRNKSLDLRRSTSSGTSDISLGRSTSPQRDQSAQAETCRNKVSL